MLIDKLKRIGFTEYESKIFIALIGKEPLNGNEISNLSGVPTPKVYGSLQSMLEKGYVSLLFDEPSNRSKGKYIATPYKKLLEMYVTSISDDVNYLQQELKKIEERLPNQSLKQDLYQIVDYDLTINTVKDFINRSQQTIYLSCWKQFEESIYEELLVAHKRGVEIIVLLFDAEESEAHWKTFYHLRLDIVEERHRAEFNIVIDHQHVVVSQLNKDNVFTVVSDNVALVKTTVNYIRHDIYVNRVLMDLKAQALNQYGDDFSKLLNI